MEHEAFEFPHILMHFAPIFAAIYRLSYHIVMM